MRTDDVLEKFSEMMVSRMEKMKGKEWGKGWFTQAWGCSPANLCGRSYNGANSFFLLQYMMSEERFKFPIFATFNQVKELGASVLKGEKSFPVLFWKFLYKDEKGDKISEESYKSKTLSDQCLCKVQPVLKSYNVFNVSQTNMEEAAPKALEKAKDSLGIKEVQECPKDTNGMYENEKLDDMLFSGKWLCPISWKDFSNAAYYKTESDEITIPKKEQFKKGDTKEEIFESGMEYYSTLLHEMVHSTGSETRLKRNIKNKRGDNDYAKEELVAELGAALVGNTLGFSSKILDNSAAYLDFWISKLKKQPNFIVSVLSDAGKAAKMIQDTIEA